MEPLVLLMLLEVWNGFVIKLFTSEGKFTLAPVNRCVGGAELSVVRLVLTY